MTDLDKFDDFLIEMGHKPYVGIRRKILLVEEYIEELKNKKSVDDEE